MSQDTVNDGARRALKTATPLFIIAAVVVVIVWDPIGAVVRSIDFSWISLPDLPGWVQFLRDLPGPGLLIVIVLLVIVGEAGRRRRRSDDGDGGSET